MPEREDGTLSLEEVSARFLRTEEALRDLISAGEGLKVESEQLANAKGALQDVASRVTDLTAGAGQLVAEIRQVLEAIEQTEPAAVLRRMDELGETVAQGNERLNRVQKGVTEAVNRSTENLVSEVQRVKVIAILAVVAAAVAALGAGLGLAL